ncbi:hypothetical protein RhiLY_02795 [Ceratobasidium sp. AG-Ba]|nr:hypothetical protein RhiLY_02795 [Ceratobasidium sp. AG-Ba]
MGELGAPMASPDRSPKYRLPVIADPSSDPNGKPTYIVESFNIALYLDERYPGPKHPIVFPEGTRILQKIASDTLTNEIGFALLQVINLLVAKPGFLDDRGRDYFCSTRESWFGDLGEIAKAEPEKWGEVRKKWDSFGPKFQLNQGAKEDGPFVMGNLASFTDFAIGGLIFWLRRAEGGDMPRWKEVTEWHGGRWARLWAALEIIEQDSTRVD